MLAVDLCRRQRGHQKTGGNGTGIVGTFAGRKITRSAVAGVREQARPGTRRNGGRNRGRTRFAQYQGSGLADTIVHRHRGQRRKSTRNDLFFLMFLFFETL